MRIIFRGKCVDLSDKIVKTPKCWLWQGGLMNTGYGRMSIGGKDYLAHRLLYESLIGPIVSETLDHLCRVRHCVNPAHLEPVSRAENVLRGDSLPAKNARKTCCPKGHPYSLLTLYISRQGYRQCRICCIERHQAKYVKIPPYCYNCCICSKEFQTKHPHAIDPVCSIPCRTKHYLLRKKKEAQQRCA